MGRSDFLKWFEAKDSRALEVRLREQYEVNGLTAWALITKAERFRVHTVTMLPESDVRRMRMILARIDRIIGFHLSSARVRRPHH